MNSSPLSHGKSLFFGFLLLLALGVWLTHMEPTQNAATISDIAVEHNGKMVLGIDLVSKSGAGLLSLSLSPALNVATGSGTVQISIPDTWKQTQVKHVPLASLVSEKATFGFKRWSIPLGASVTYTMSPAPDYFRIFNPSKLPLEVRLRMTNLETGIVTERSLLFSESDTFLP